MGKQTDLPWTNYDRLATTVVEQVIRIVSIVSSHHLTNCPLDGLENWDGACGLCSRLIYRLAVVVRTRSLQGNITTLRLWHISFTFPLLLLTKWFWFLRCSDYLWTSFRLLLLLLVFGEEVIHCWGVGILLKYLLSLSSSLVGLMDGIDSCSQPTKLVG